MKSLTSRAFLPVAIFVIIVIKKMDLRRGLGPGESRVVLGLAGAQVHGAHEERRQQVVTQHAELPGGPSHFGPPRDL